MSWNSSTMIERKRSCSRSRIAASSRSRSRARSWRSSKSSADSRSFAAAYARGEAARAAPGGARGRATASSSSAACSTRLPRLLVGRRALAAAAEAARGRAAARAAAVAVERERLRRRCARCVGRVQRRRPGSAPRRASSLEPLGEARPLAELELERPAGGAQRLVDAGQHPPQAGGAVRREQAQPLGLASGAERGQRGLERLAAEHPRLALVEHAEARVEPGRERMRLQQAEAEAVDRRDPGAVELAREVVAAELDEPRADPRAQLAGRPLGVGDDEERLDVEAALADRLGEALDEHGRLPGAGAGRDEDRPRGRDRRRLLLRVRASPHARFTRHMRQSVAPRRAAVRPAGRAARRPRGSGPARPRASSRAGRPAPRTPPRRGSRVLTKPGSASSFASARSRPARPPLAGERPVEAAERLDADEVAEREHVERDLEPQLLLDLGRRVAGAPDL